MTVENANHEQDDLPETGPAERSQRLWRVAKRLGVRWQSESASGDTALAAHVEVFALVQPTAPEAKAASPLRSAAALHMAPSAAWYSQVTALR